MIDAGSVVLAAEAFGRCEFDTSPLGLKFASPGSAVPDIMTGPKTGAGSRQTRLALEVDLTGGRVNATGQRGGSGRLLRLRRGHRCQSGPCLVPRFPASRFREGGRPDSFMASGMMGITWMRGFTSLTRQDCAD